MAKSFCNSGNYGCTFCPVTDKNTHKNVFGNHRYKSNSSAFFFFF